MYVLGTDMHVDHYHGRYLTNEVDIVVAAKPIFTIFDALIAPPNGVLHHLLY